MSNCMHTWVGDNNLTAYCSKCNKLKFAAEVEEVEEVEITSNKVIIPVIPNSVKMYVSQTKKGK